MKKILMVMCAALLLTGCAKKNPVEVSEWTKSSPIYEVNVRQYTAEGTFDAFALHLDEIKDMGIDIIWLMPVHPISETKRSGKLGSYYSITDYKEINPEFGNKEDFKELVDLAHEKGMYVMMDWVANHTGWDSPWISEHPDWYTQNSSGQIISPENMGWPDVADLNYDNTEMRKEMIECMKYWVKEFDIDGFRCDFANGVPTDFWEEARTEIETVKPVYMLAEDGKTTSLLENAFDFNYNWGLYDTMVQVAHDNKSPSKLKLYIPNNYPEGTYTLNFLDNHDKNSYEGTIVENFGEEAIPAFFAYIYTIPGVPLVYTGDEIGLDHAIAFMEKDTVNWDRGTADYREFLAKLAQIRKDNPALYAGELGGEIEYLDCENGNLVAFTRKVENNQITCVINLSKREIEIDGEKLLENAGALDGKVLLHGPDDTKSNEFSKNMTISPWEFWIIEN